MKFRFAAITATLFSSLLVAPQIQAHAMESPVAATRQSIRIISISDHCLDEFDEEDVIYITEGEPVCKVTVQVRGRGSTKSKILLQYDDYEDGWTNAGFKTHTTNESGKATFVLTTNFPDQPNDDCYEDDSYTHRFAIARSGKYKAFKSSTFDITYNSSEDNPACLGYDDSIE
jgi:hypothetical protein